MRGIDWPVIFNEGDHVTIKKYPVMCACLSARRQRKFFLGVYTIPLMTRVVLTRKEIIIQSSESGGTSTGNGFDLKLDVAADKDGCGHPTARPANCKRNERVDAV